MKPLRGYSTQLVCLAAFVCLSSLPASATARGGSDYGVSALQTCGTVGPFNGVDATCYLGGGGFPDDYLFNFTLANPSASTTVTSFTINFGATPVDYGLVVGPCANSLPVPCAANYTTTNLPPFTVTGTLGTGSEVFNFSGFTGNQSGQVTVFFSYNTASPQPTITNVTTTSATPEPGSAVLLLAGMVLVVALLKVHRRKIAIT